MDMMCRVYEQMHSSLKSLGSPIIFGVVIPLRRYLVSVLHVMELKRENDHRLLVSNKVEKGGC